jgi:hypothetical protein
MAYSELHSPHYARVTESSDTYKQVAADVMKGVFISSYLLTYVLILKKKVGGTFHY